MSYTPTNWVATDVVTATRMNSLEQAVGEMNMSYTPHTWTDGDVLTATRMNALEQAVASGGGGGDISTATVSVSFADNPNIIGLDSAYVTIYTDDGGTAVEFYYSNNGYGLPFSELGTPTQLLIPVYDGYKSDISQITFLSSDGSMLIDTSNSSVTSGSAEIDGSLLNIWGDCVLNLALMYAD